MYPRLNSHCQLRVPSLAYQWQNSVHVNDVSTVGFHKHEALDHCDEHAELFGLF
jgi:hypothetical protein